MSTSTAPVEATREKSSPSTARPETTSAPSSASQRATGTRSTSSQEQAPPEDRVERQQDEPPGNELGGLVDGLKSWAAPVAHAVEHRAEKIETQHERDWSSPREALRNLDHNGDLSTYSGSQLDKLNVLSQVDRSAEKSIRGHVADYLQRSDSVEDLPNNRSFQSLVQREVTSRKPDLLRTLTDGPTRVDQANSHLRSLADQAVEESLSQQLEGRSGDDDAERAIEDFGGDVRQLARQDPALLQDFRSAARQKATSDETRDRLQSIADADNTLWDDARGTLGDVAGTVVDNLPVVGSTLPGGAMLKHVPVVGDGVQAVDDARSQLLKDGGDWLGDRAGDLVRGNGAPTGMSLLGDDVDRDLRGGLGDFANSTVDGLTGSLADPSGTARGGVELAMRVPNPVRTLVEGRSMSEQFEHDKPFWDALAEAASADYRKSFDDYGPVGGGAHVLADVALTVGTGGGEGAAVKGLKAAGLSRTVALAETYQRMTALSTALPSTGLADTRALAWAGRLADRYQNLNEPLRRVLGSVRGDVSGGADTADEQEGG